MVIRDSRTRAHGVVVGVWLALLLAACGGGEMSLTEYVDRLNVIVEDAREQYERLVATPQGAVLVAQREELTDFAPQDLHVALDHMREIEHDVDEATSAIDPPEQVAELHEIFFDFDGDFIASQEALAERAGTAADWEELSASPEMEAYRAALAKDKQDCLDSESLVNTLGEQGEVFAETPWISGELKQVFEIALGCSGYPDHPEDVYRPAATSAP